MKSVAAYKWVNNKSIIQKSSADLVIQRAYDLAVSLCYTDLDFLNKFFIFQIDAAVEIQENWFKIWNKNEASFDQNPEDLMTVIFPKILSIGDEIVYQLKVIENELGEINESDYPFIKENVSFILNTDYASESIKKYLIELVARCISTNSSNVI